MLVTLARLEKRLAVDAGLRQVLDDLRVARGLLKRTPRRKAPRNFTLNPTRCARACAASDRRADPALCRRHRFHSLSLCHWAPTPCCLRWNACGLRLRWLTALVAAWAVAGVARRPRFRRTRWRLLPLPRAHLCRGGTAAPQDTGPAAAEPFAKSAPSESCAHRCSARPRDLAAGPCRGSRAGRRAIVRTWTAIRGASSAAGTSRNDLHPNAESRRTRARHP